MKSSYRLRVDVRHGAECKLLEGRKLTGVRARRPWRSEGSGKKCIVSKKEAALIALADMTVAIAKGADITAVDIQRFLERPQGPHRHQLEVPRWPVPDQVPGTAARLADLRVLPNGALSWLWRIVGGRGPYLRVRIDERDWTLEADDADQINGLIIGFNTKHEPIIEMHSSTPRRRELGAPFSEICIGDRRCRHTISPAADRKREGWTIGADGLLYCIETYLMSHASRLVAHDPLTGDRVSESGKILEGFGNRITSLAVRSPQEFIVVSDDGQKSENDDRPWPWYTQFMKGEVKRGSRMHGLATVLTGGFVHLLHGEHVARDPASSACWWVRLPDGDNNPNPRFRGHGRAPYRHSLTMLDVETNRYAYVGKLSHGKEGWVLPRNEQPGFDYVTDLFRHNDEWRYWGLAQEQLFLMKLP